MIRRRSLIAATLPLAAPALAQNRWPMRPITVIVAYPAGGANDIVARTTGEPMRAVLGQPLIIENRGGAAGTLGAGFAARATPDGYTLLMAAGAHTLAPALQRNLTYDIVGDFRPISRVAASSFVLVTRNDLGAADVQALIAMARAAPGRLNYASSGAGAPPHLAAVLFQEMTGTRMEHVPYAGDTPAIADIVAGHVDLGFMSLAAAKALVDAGRMRALAVTDLERNPLYPDLPSVAESGLPGYEVGTWWGLLAPRGTPDIVIDRMNEAVLYALRQPEVTARFTELGLTPVGSTPEEFAVRIRDDVERFGRIVRSAGISP
ncbi:MAG: Tripartite-type tricarboxylate transporter, receptor component TctC [Rubritepida sp.]|nr:Tripartite-type tricarboxylate transporter, receptor component TctC [Rubritepida sp.]